MEGDKHDASYLGEVKTGYNKYPEENKHDCENKAQ